VKETKTLPAVLVAGDVPPHPVLFYDPRAALAVLFPVGLTKRFGTEDGASERLID